MTSELSNDFKIKFDGQLHQVNANTLITSLINLSTAIQEINKGLNPDRQIEINIKATEKGSFLLWMGLALAKLPQLLETTGSGAKNIIDVLAGILTIKNALRGKQPEKIEEDGDKIKLHTNNGTIIVIDKFTYNCSGNQTIQDAISNTFEMLQEDSSISGFAITDVQEKPYFEVERKDFEQLAIKSEVIEENKRILTEIADLFIFKIVFDNKYKWEFYFKGNKISATVTDETFFQRIDEGESFSKGDSLTVEIEVQQIFEKSVNTFINQSYTIKRVLQHTPRGEQKKMNFKTDGI